MSEGSIDLVELFCDKNDDDIYSTQIHSNLISYDDSYSTFGNYFDLDTTSNKLYISNSGRLDQSDTNEINVMQVCLPGETYSLDTDLCTQQSSDMFTQGGQSEDVLSCSGYDDSITDLRYFADNLCDYQCDTGTFGQF